MSKIEEALSVIIQELNLQTENDTIFCQKVAQKMRQTFSGYHTNLHTIFANKLPNTGLKSEIKFQQIPFITYCKHHMTPIVGTITTSYTPNQWIIGLSKITECINAFTQRLQLQENLTIEIAECIFQHLQPQSVSVTIEAQHYCMQKSVNDHLPLITTSHTI